MFTEQREQSVIELCRNLIKLKSYSGQEGELISFLKTFLEKGNCDEVFIDEYGNLIAAFKGNHEGPSVLFDSHIDTVPVDNLDNWTKDPFSGEIVDGRIYGRGSSDMKGAASAMLQAASFFKEDTEANFSGTIYVACGVHEECFEGVAARKISEKFKPDYVIIGEASELNLNRGQRGRAEIVVETFGVPAHSSNPQKGVNAVYQMTKVVNHLQSLPPTEHELLGEGILELTDIKSSPYPGASVVPSYCKVTYDRRLLVGETEESTLAPIKQILEKLAAEDPTFRGEVSFASEKEDCFTGEIIESERFFPGWVLEENDEFIEKALTGLTAVGIKPEVRHYSFCTNGSHYAGEAGIKTLGFGPSKENLAHIDDEYIEIEQLLLACKGYFGMMKSMMV